MRFSIVGAGAIGGFIGAALARSGNDVGFTARGEHLRAMQKHGLTVRSQIGNFCLNVYAADDLRKLERPDVILLTVKAHQLRELRAQIIPYRDPAITIIPMQNGIPFWYSPQWHLASVDPQGELAACMDPRQIIGSVVQVSGKIVEPGVIEQAGRRTYVFGELNGELTRRLRAIAAAFEQAQLNAQIESNIRWAVWYKLLGNVSLNPISALTRATIKTMIEDHRTAELLRQLMSESIAVARALGVELKINVEERLAMSAQLADVKTSMLQDVEARRRLELDPIVGAVVELAHRLAVPVPATQHVYALTKLLDATLQAQRKET